MALRNSVIAKIWAALEKSPFTVADFDVTFGEKGEPLVQILFRHRPEFRLDIAQNYDKKISITMAPGEHQKVEKYVSDDLSKTSDVITAWTRYVRDELRASLPVYAELDELRDVIEKHVNEHVSNPEERFSDSEVEDLRSKLDEMMKRFHEMEERSEITAQELNRLNQEITSIKTNLSGYPKGVWYKTAANRLWTTVNKVAGSQESRQVIAQAARKMLGLDPSP